MKGKGKGIQKHFLKTATNSRRKHECLSRNEKAGKFGKKKLILFSSLTISRFPESNFAPE